jgi:hypothetical protein
MRANGRHPARDAGPARSDLPNKETVVNATRRILPAALSAGLVAALGAAAQAVTIPDGGTVEADHVGLIHFRIAEGCDGAATDGLEVTVPEELRQVVPEAVPGWAVETETVERDGSPEVSVVRWTGGPLPDGQLLEFGLRATFPDEPGLVLEVPAVQRCGTMALDWSGISEDMPAPVVRTADRVGATDLIALADTVTEVSTTLEDVEAQLGDVDAPNVRSRVSDLETTIEELTAQLTEVTERLDALEAALQ